MADAATTPEDTAVTIPVLANDAHGPPNELGQVLSVTAVTQGTRGAVMVVGTSVVYTPAADFNGTDTFTYTVSDGDGGTATGTVTVTVGATNDPPTATPDALAVAEDAGPTVMALLANDGSAPDPGETLSVVSEPSAPRR